MKKKFVLIILLSAISLPARAKVTPEEKFRIIQKHLIESIREKIRIMPSQAPDMHGIGLPKKDSDTPLSLFETMVSKDSYPESELHAAINPSDSTNIVVSAMEQGGTTILTFPIYYTKNFGNTWSRSTFSGQSPVTGQLRFGGGDPMFVYDADGKNLFYTSIDIAVSGSTFDSAFANIWLARSTNGGKTFSTSPTAKLASGKLLNLFTPYPSGSMIDKEWMTVDRSNSPYRGTIYGSYLTINAVDTTETFRVARLLPGQTNFSAVALIPTKDVIRMQIGTVDVDNSGNVHMTFMGSPDERVYYIYHSVSTDGGKTFSDPNIVSRAELPYHSFTSKDYYVPGIDSSRQFPSIQVACGRPGTANAGDIYCIWEALGIASHGNSGEDIYFARSTDNGTSWSAPLIVNNDSPEFERHQFRPSIFVNAKGVIIAAWYDGRDADDNTAVNYYVAYSFDGGKSFVNQAAVSAQPTDFSTIGSLNYKFGIGEYLQVVASDNYSIPIWTDGRNDDGTLNIISAIYPISPSASTVERRETVTSGFRVTSIRPNPSRDKIGITLDISHRTTIGISLINMLGIKAASTSPVIYEQGEQTIPLSLENIPAGSYVLHTESSSGFIDRILEVVK